MRLPSSDLFFLRNCNWLRGTKEKTLTVVDYKFMSRAWCNIERTSFCLNCTSNFNCRCTSSHLQIKRNERQKTSL